MNCDGCGLPLGESVVWLGRWDELPRHVHPGCEGLRVEADPLTPAGEVECELDEAAVRASLAYPWLMPPENTLLDGVGRSGLRQGLVLDVIVSVVAARSHT